MSELTVYWRGWSEKQLASYQQNQGNSNHCAKYAAATALNLLYGKTLAGDSLVSWLDHQLFKGTLRYTILGNQNGSFVYQAANLTRVFAGVHGLSPEVKIGRGTPQILQTILLDGNSLVLVSMTYFQDREPAIAYGKNNSSSLKSTRLVGGHLMLLGAYDPQHKNNAETPTPWGFLSSWPGNDYLYWMTDHDFRRTWGQLTPFNMVKIRRKTL